jgi:hypothetical protein
MLKKIMPGVALVALTTLAPPAGAGEAPVLPQGITLDGPSTSDGRVLFSEHGRKAVVIGDLRRAHDIAVVIPGSDVDEARFDRTVLPKARALYEQAHGDLAAIAWLGYETPKGLGIDAATGRLARAGATALSAFVDWLHDVTTARIHVFGHSYGSVVVGLAASRLAVDDIVFVASPGVRAHSAHDLGGQARVWAARAPGDWIRRIPHIRLADFGHGTDPASPEFGARLFNVDGVDNHDGYFRPGTESLRNLARIALGHDEEVR